MIQYNKCYREDYASLDIRKLVIGPTASKNEKKTEHKNQNARKEKLIINFK